MKMCRGVGVAFLCFFVWGVAQAQPRAADCDPSNKATYRPGCEGSLSSLVKKVLPAVVTIRVTLTRVVKSRGNAPQFQFPPGSPFEEFFKHFGPPPGGKPSSQRELVLGSGFIVRKDGVVLTNNHVVVGEGSSEKFSKRIKVILHDGREFAAKVLGRDKQMDIAVLKIDANNLPTLSFGDSTRAEVGDRVIAAGNPLGLPDSITTGIISARGRDNLSRNSYDSFIQTDAPINKGNSGGPLLNMDGQVIGVNTAILSPNGGSIGIGLAIPSNQASLIANQLVRHGKVIRAWLGVSVQPLTRAMAKLVGLPNNKGALVASVYAKSPAEKAGFKPGDVITSFGGKPVTNNRKLPYMVSSSKPHKTYDVVIWRRGKASKPVSKTLKVTLGVLSSATRKGAQLNGLSRDGERALSKTKLYGATLETMTRSLARELHILSSHDTFIQGLVVLEVGPGSPAEESGLRPGMVIVSVNSHAVENLVDLKKALAQRKKDSQGVVVRAYFRGNYGYYALVPGK